MDRGTEKEISNTAKPLAIITMKPLSSLYPKSMTSLSGTTAEFTMLRREQYSIDCALRAFDGRPFANLSKPRAVPEYAVPRDGEDVTNIVIETENANE